MLYYLMNMEYRKLGGIETKYINKDSQDIVKPSFYFIRKLIVGMIKFLNKLIK